MFESNPRISVIMPVYKAERYLHKSIDCILNQTFQDLELLLVDDGSPDALSVICKSLYGKIHECIGSLLIDLTPIMGAQ